MKKLLLLILLAVIGFLGFRITNSWTTSKNFTVIDPSPTPTTVHTQTPSPTKVLPSKKILSGGIHTFQTFNNCGPSSLSMALSYYGINDSQQRIGQYLRPYQISSGDNDDKSVTLAELATYAKRYDLMPIHRPNGSIKLVKEFINLELPVITRTILEKGDDIGHYRVVKGYDGDFLVQDDSLQGKDLKYSSLEFEQLWYQYGNEYLVLVPTDKIDLVKELLSEDFDEQRAWENYSLKLEASEKQVYTYLNLAVAYYRLGQYQKSIENYEQAKPKLSKRDIWYQLEPIYSYFELGDYDKVFSESEEILNGGNKANTELYIIRAKIYAQTGDLSKAKQEIALAVKYNVNNEEAKKLQDQLN